MNAQNLLSLASFSKASSYQICRLEYGKDGNMTLSANHLQKLRLSLKFTSPSGSPFNPQQVFLKLVHESHVEHLYLVKSSEKGFQLTLVCLAPVAKTIEFKAS
jgi:oligosaccharyltransferase complex subunit delta (ribophorin II)